MTAGGNVPGSSSLEVVRAILEAAASDAPASLDEVRARMESYPQPLPDGTTMEPVDVGGVPAELLRTRGAVSGRAVLFLHGGGYRTGSPRSHRRLAALIGASARADVLNVEYGLAPEHPCPAGLDDAITAYEWLRWSGAADVILAGDSAGGGLALAVLLALRDAGAPLPAGAVLMAPWLDLTLSGSSVESLADVDLMLSADSLRDAAASYAAELPLEDPRVSPLFGRLEGLPPMLVQVGGVDILRDDSVRLAERAPVTLEVEADLPHVYQGFAGILPEADRAIERIGAWIEEVVG